MNTDEGRWPEGLDEESQRRDAETRTPADDAGDVAALREKAEWWEHTCEYWHDQTKARERTIALLEVERDEARAEVDSLRTEVERLTQHRSRMYDDVANTRSWAESIRVERDSLRVTLAAVGVDPDLVAEGVRFALKAWARKYDETSINLLTQTHLDDALVDGVLIALGQQPALDPTVIDFTDLRAILAADPVSLADVREGSES